MNLTFVQNLFGLTKLPEISYIICTTPRSGSRYVASALEQTQLAGRPRDHFRFWCHFAQTTETDLDDEHKAWRLPPVDYMRKIFELGTGANGVFGVIMTPQQLEIVATHLKTFVAEPERPIAELLAAVFPNLHYIYLRRRDKVRQTISLVKAMQTKQWFELEPAALSEIARTLTPAQFAQLTAQTNTRLVGKLQYNALQIALWQYRLAAEDEAWEAFFKASGIQPYRVIYEDWVAAYEPMIRAILDYLKIPDSNSFAVSRSPLKRQSDAINTQWAQSYAVDLAAPNLHRFGLPAMPGISYIICTTPLSDSNFLSHALGRTGLAGHPYEYFVYWYYMAHAPEKAPSGTLKAWLLPPADYMKKVIACGIGDNGVFGVKMMQYELAVVANQLKAFAPPCSPLLNSTESTAEILAAIFPNLRYLYLTRRDKIRQAVSWAKAIQSKQWEEGISLHSGHLNRPSSSAAANSLANAANDLKYNYYLIAWLHQSLLEAEQAWKEYFHTAGIQPYQIIYEELLNDYEKTMVGILDYLHIQRSENFMPRQPLLPNPSDAINEEWVQRYTADLAKPALPYFGLHKMPEISYLICTTPRSGSTYLARTLENTGIAGRPRENFRFWAFFAHGLQPDHDPEWKEWVLPPVDYMRKLFLVGTSANHVFGIKIMWTHLQVIVSQLKAFMPADYHFLDFHGKPEQPQFSKAKTEANGAEILAEFFPSLHYLYLTRRDKIRQAVSLVKARQSNKWHDEGPALDNGNKAFLPQRTTTVGTSSHGKENLCYDFDQIFKEHQELLNAEKAWEDYFYETGIQPYRVIYEDFLASYESTILAILEYLKIPCSDNFEFDKPPLKKQSDAINEEWVRRYTAELAQSAGEFSRAGGRNE